MKLLVLLGLAAAVLAQDQTQTQSLAISATASPTATLPITPPSQRALATCSADPLWRRLRNAEGVDPCTLAMNLQRTCTTSVSSIATPTSTSTPTTTPTPGNHKSSNVGIIVGASLGGVGLILLLITIIFCYLRHRQRKWEEDEGVNRLDKTFVISKPTPRRQSLHKDPVNRYGAGGLFSPTNDNAFEKPGPIKTETALPDVLADEHQQGKPEYAMPAPTPSYPNPGGGFGRFPTPQTQYAPVPNPGVAGVGAGGRGLQNENRESYNGKNQVTPRDGPQGAAAQMLAADVAAARAREGAFREDFSAEGQGYQTSTDADGQSRNGGNSRAPFLPMPYPYGASGNGNDNGKAPVDQHDEEPHALSTVDDTSISLYPSSVDRLGDHPAPFVGGFSPVPEKPKEEYQIPDRGYSSQSSPPLDSDPFGANRRPTAFSRVFGERQGNMAGVGAGRGSAGSSPTSPTAAQGRVPIAIVSRAGTSPVLNRPNISPALRRGPSLGNSAVEMGFGRQHQAAVEALAAPPQRDSTVAGGAPAAPRSAQNKDGSSSLGTFQVKSGLAQMLKGGVIMDVVNAEQARIAEEAGACAVMALERVPADIRKEGGVARMSDPKMIKEIVDAVTIPVMAKVRIGHFVEAQILQAIGIDYIDESEVLTPADEQHHINKHSFRIPFVCGATSLGEALRRISEGAAMIRTKGEAGTGNVVEAVRHARAVNAEIRKAAGMTDEELYSYAKEIQAPFHLLKETARLKRLPVVSFAAGGVATPADAAMMMQLGFFVGSGIFLSGDPAKRARAIVQAVTHYNNPKVLAEVSEDLGEAMVGLTIDKDLKGGRMAGRGW
ncbi:Pyridoxal 5'-phosphate synthase subunit snz1 [Ceratobasidium sp. 423]|nr:Pyridoxal 5'-phosphate synthase subunit snz1 [Ceratobasidium sp. 423]